MRMNERYELREHGKVYIFFNKLLKNPYFLIAPAVIFDLWLTVYPMCFAIYMSFFKWDPISGRKKFLWLGNFRYLFQSEDFRKVFSNTIIYMLAILFVGLFLKLLLGILLNKRTLAHNIVQTVSFTPHIIASVSIAVIFMWLMDPNNGIFNMALKALHLPTSYWYKGRDSALFSIIIVSIWSGLGAGALRIIAGLRSIPEYIYEAAKLDKSSPVKTFFKITSPLLSPTLLYMVVTTTASAFTSFDTVKMMTNGGPDNATNLIAFYIYQQGLGFNQYGRAMAAAVILLLISGGLAIINFTVLDKKVHYQ